MSVGLAGVGQLHPGLGPSGGGQADLRVALGSAWIGVGGGATSDVPLADGLGSLGLARFGGEVGARLLSAPSRALGVAALVDAVSWRVADVAGDRSRWSVAAGARLVGEQRIAGPVALELGVAAMADTVRIEVEGGGERPGEVRVSGTLGIRVGQ